MHVWEGTDGGDHCEGSIVSVAFKPAEALLQWLGHMRSITVALDCWMIQLMGR